MAHRKLLKRVKENGSGNSSNIMEDILKLPYKGNVSRIFYWLVPSCQEKTLIFMIFTDIYANKTFAHFSSYRKRYKLM